MKRPICLAALSLASLAPAGAVTPISFTGTNYIQDFDTLPTAGTNPLVSGPGKGPLDVPTSAANVSLSGWSFANTPVGTGAVGVFRFDNGGNNGGAVYSYGTTDSTDRALGSLASGSTVSDFGLTLVNDSAGIYTSFTLSYTGEQWRYGGATTPGNTGTVINTLGFSYSVGATDLETGTFTSVPELSFSSMVNTNPDPAVLPSVSTALNGNLAANQTAISFTVSGLLWNPGTTLTLRWADTNDTGNDNGLAVDNLTFSAIATTVNKLTWNTTGGTWDTTSANWSGDSAIYSDGSIVQFTDARVGVVNIDAGGVAPAKIEVSNATGSYTFQGGSLTGSAELVKTGAGTLILSAQSQLTGKMDIQAGTVKTTASDLLADGTAISIGASALLDLQDNSEVIGELALSAGTVDSGAAGLLTLSGNVAVQQNAQTSYIKGNLKTGPGTHTVTVADGAGDIDLQIDAQITDGVRIAFSGAGTTALNGDNGAFSGGVSLNTGKLIVNNPNSLGTGSFFFNGGTFASSVALIGANAITNPVSIGGNVTIDGTNAVEFTKVTANFGSLTKVTTVIGQVTFSGVMPNGTTTAGVLNKAGSGTLTLTAINTYTGATTVQGGFLVVGPTGAIDKSVSLSVSPQAGLVLQSNMSLNDNIVMTLVSGSSVSLEFTGAEIIGALSINGTFLPIDNYTLVELNQAAGQVIFLGNGGASLTVTAVPEPGTVALIALGLGVVLLGARRRRA